MNTQIISEWKSEGILLNGPAEASTIKSCELKLGFTFPEDFKKFYSICNGFTEWQMDSKMLSLWSLRRIETDNFHPGFIAFADYNANGSQIGFKIGNVGIYKDYELISFCETFEEFINHWQIDSGAFI